VNYIMNIPKARWSWSAQLATIFAVIVIAFGAARVSWAQTANTGAVTGTVKDSSGAVVQNAEVVIVSEATAAKRRATTGTDGIYRVPLLPPGSYRVEASTSGFKLAVRPGVPVRVTETTGLDIELEVGSTNEAVTVQGTPQLTQTDSNALGRVTDEKSVESLPLVSRNFTQIIGLSPGVSVGLTDATQLGTGNGGMVNFTNEDLSVNGARNYDNNFQMDGVGANDQIAFQFNSGGVAIPNPDSISEFKVLTGQYDASYGRNAGANVDVVTKSGSNQLHGNLFEFFRNEDLNANTFFFNADGVPRGILRQNQFGGTIGGPIKKDKLLFFGSYQGTRQLNGVASGCSATFVGPALTNDRSAPALGAIFGGQTGALGGVAVAPNGSNINPIALKLLNLKLPSGSYVVPTPQKIVNGEGQYAFSDPCTFHEDQFMTNVDFLPSAKSKLSAKFFFSDQGYTQTLPGGTVPGSPDVVTPGYRNLALTYEYIFSPTVLNQVEFGFHRIATKQNPSSSFNFPEIGSTVIPQSNALGAVYVGQETIGAAGSESSMSTNAYTLQDTVTLIHGRHNLRFGGGVTRTDARFYWFQGSYLILLSMPDLLLGQSAVQNGSPFSNVYLSVDSPGLVDSNYLVWNPWVYAQDDYKASPRLTLNLGLRYERIGDFADRNGHNAGFDTALANPNPPASGSQAGYVVASNCRCTVPAGSVRAKNEFAINGDGQSTFAPRVGFAWQVLPKSSRFLLRGGYGIYYSTMIGLQVAESAFSPPWALFRYPSGTANAAATFANPFGRLLSPSDFPIFPAYSPSTQLVTYYTALDARPAVTQEYSMNLQTQLGHNYLLEVGYVGSRGTHQVEMISANQAGWATPSNPIRGETTNTLANLQSRVPIEGFTPFGLDSVQTTGNSWYNSLQASLTKRFSHGFQFLASYTYARLFDTEGGQTNTTGGGVFIVPGNQNNRGARYGPASTVRPHRFVVSFVESLPKVRGAFVGSVLNDWSVSGVVTIVSGHPLSIYATNANNVFGITGAAGDFAQWASGCTKSQLETPGPAIKKLSNYFNQACIGSYPVVGDDGIATSFGNMGPGLVNGPGMSNVDLALIKRVPASWFGRESNWEFRAEAFNAFNTPHFADPDTNVTDGAAFGVISRTIANPRVIQLALKFNF
jgi:outer membrane receptor protein involved in Fe transport